jgi:hypothetical protein
VSRQLLTVSPDEPGGSRTVEEALAAARATLDAREPAGSAGDGIRVDTAEPVSVLGCALRDDRGAGLRGSRHLAGAPHRAARRRNGAAVTPCSRLDDLRRHPRSGPQRRRNV